MKYLDQILKKFRRIKLVEFFKKYNKFPREYRLLFFFWFIFFIVIIRLFYLQVVQWEYYSKLLYSQHMTKSLLRANRWNIYLTDKSWNQMQLTENVDLYNVFVDPKFVKNKPKLISLLTPIIYKHFCEINWLNIPSKEDCIRNIEDFADTKILPEENKIFYSSWDENNVVLSLEDFDQQKEDAINNFSSWTALSMISQRLDQTIKNWIRDKNYFGFFDNDKLLDDLKTLNKEYIYIASNYIYFIPSKVSDSNEAAKIISHLFKQYWYNYSVDDIKVDLMPQEIRYIKLVSEMNSQLAKEVKDLKKQYYDEKIKWIPLLHWVWLEQEERRFYPYWTFLSHVLWYVDKSWKAFYGIEQYFDSMLKWKDWKMLWLSVPWIWEIGSNSIEIEQPLDWYDVYLTIDPSIQKETEKLTKLYYTEFRPDNIAVLVLDPNSWKVVADVSYPNFDPNQYENEYKVRPLRYEDRYLIDQDDYVDFPILILDGDKLRVASYDDRKNPSLTKYIFKNYVWPQIFLDKNISSPYEPWSIFKAFTLAIWIDSDEISLYDFYQDDMRIVVWPYSISNVHTQCKGRNTFLNALEWSCNVGMVRIAQKIQRYVYYSYIQRIWFWQKTWIELAWEESWEVSGLQKFSLARFFNNAFWQWLLVTPIQIAVWYSALVNWWYLIKPTIIDKLYDKNTWEFITFDKKIVNRIFKQKTSDDVKEALFQVMDSWDLNSLSIQDYTLWWKTGTSQIAFKWEYQQWNWWINGSFVWMVSRDNLKYVIAIQVRRPRTCAWWVCTAWRVFKDLAKFLIEYDGIKK